MQSGEQLNTSSEPGLPVLSYAPRRRSRAWIRRTLALLALIACGLLVYAFAPRLQLLWLQKRCLGWERRSPSVVYETEPQAARKLLASSPSLYESWSHNQGQWTVASAVSRDWRAFRKSLQPPDTSLALPSPIMFLGELVDPGGRHRLVYVAYGVESSESPTPDPSLDDGWSVTIIQPGSLLENPELVTHYCVWRQTGRNYPVGPVRIFAGHADASNATATARYTADGDEGTFKMWLDTPDHVQVEVTGPLKSRPPRRPGHEKSRSLERRERGLR